MVNTTISVMIPADLIQKLESIAQRKQRSMSFKVREYIEAGLDTKKEYGYPVDDIDDSADEDVDDLVDGGS